MSIFDITNWRFIDQTTLGSSFSPLHSFAIDDTLCASVAEENSLPTIRTWVHHKTIVLGIQDSRLPHIENGLRFLNEQDYNVIVRNSGGLAVVLDEGILNISLIIKENRQISINSGYEAMVEIISAMFAAETTKIQVGEVIGSYCPGSFDLSIDGKKFAGISQRRVRGGIAVQIYLCVNGSGSERAAVIKQFYDLAVNGKVTKFQYPLIVPETMASLQELLGLNLDVVKVMKRLLMVLANTGGDGNIASSQLSLEEQPLFETNYQRMRKRQLENYT